MILGNRRGPKVYRLRPGTRTDGYGDPVEDWDAPVKVELKRATFDDVTSAEEDGVVRRLVRNERQLFVPGKADLTLADRVEIEGVAWRVDGDPVVRRGLASGTYTTATLRRVSA